MSQVIDIFLQEKKQENLAYLKYVTLADPLQLLPNATLPSVLSISIVVALVIP